jgi:hypothetical protein
MFFDNQTRVVKRFVTAKPVGWVFWRRTPQDDFDVNLRFSPLERTGGGSLGLFSPVFFGFWLTAIE